MGASMLRAAWSADFQSYWPFDRLSFTKFLIFFPGEMAHSLTYDPNMTVKEALIAAYAYETQFIAHREDNPFLLEERLGDIGVASFDFDIANEPEHELAKKMAGMRNYRKRVFNPLNQGWVLKGTDVWLGCKAQ